GPAPVTFDLNGSNAAKNATATFAGAGSYAITVTITNGAGRSTTSSLVFAVQSTVTSVVLAPNPATESAGQPLTETTTARDQFATPISGALTFAFTQVSGPGVASFNPPNAAVTDIVFDQAGNYVVRVTASDGVHTVFADASVAVSAVNHPPVVSAGP